jgi:ribose-phosphate pyrophosphokinase
MPHAISLFAIGASRDYGERLSSYMEVPLLALEERDFEDGEHKIRPLSDVRGHDVYVIHSTHGDSTHSANDKLCRLLFLIGALKDSGAARVTAVAPYLCYARKDRRTQPNDPITTKYVAKLFEAVGTDAVIVVEVHNLAAFENAFRCRTEHVVPDGAFVTHFAPQLHDVDVAVVSPDIGGGKRAERMRLAIARALGREPSPAFVEKHRARGMVWGEALVGEVAGRTALIVDDLISTGGTIIRAAKACREAGATRVLVAASHGIFQGEAIALLAKAPIDSLAVLDTVDGVRSAVKTVGATLPISVVDSTPLLADIILRSHGAA